MLTLLGLGVLGLSGTTIAAKLGFVDYSVDKEFMGHTFHLELNKDNPIKLSVD